jgi:ribosome-associated toxin RatA of RatAB toxin-antitoxin module
LVVLALALSMQAQNPTVEALEAPDGVKGLRAVFDVVGAGVDADACIETLWDVRRFRTIFPDVKSLEVQSPAPDKVPTATQLDVKFTVDAVLQTTTYTLRRTFDRAARKIEWHRIAGDVPTIRGSWSVMPVSSKDPSAPAVVRVTYTSFVDVGYFVPTGMVRDIAMGKVNEMAGRVRAACAPPKRAAP